MTSIDNSTLVFCQVILSLLFAATFLWLCRSDGALGAVRWWGGGALILTAIGRMLLLPSVDNGLLIGLAYCLFFSALACFYRGIVLIIDPRRKPVWVWIVLVPLDAVTLILSMRPANDDARVMVEGLGCMLFRGACALELSAESDRVREQPFLQVFSAFMGIYALYPLWFIVINDQCFQQAAPAWIHSQVSQTALLVGNVLLSTSMYLLYLIFWNRAILLVSGQEAITDILTGRRNRRGIELSLAMAWEQARYAQTVFSIAAIDIDHFKDINDRFGHAVGDVVIQRVAASIFASIRASDILGRIGGDELVVVFPQTAIEEAHEISHRICNQLLSETTEPHASISIGVTQWQPGEAPHETLVRADMALYESKRQGRSQVTIGA